MRVFINSPEQAKLIYTGYSGRVLIVETHIGSAVQGGTTNSIITGKHLHITSSTVEVKKAKVVLANGRIKELDIDKIEMQEGDEVEFITADDGKNIYIKNSTTGVTNIADLYYMSRSGIGLASCASLAAIAFGVYFLFDIFKHPLFSLILGLPLIFGGFAVITLTTNISNRLKGNSESDFHEKVRATGIVVSAFKPIKVL